MSSLYILEKQLKECREKLTDYETRYCKNCKFYNEVINDQEAEMQDVITGCSQIYVETNYATNLQNFGCSKFIRKTNEKIYKNKMSKL